MREYASGIEGHRIYQLASLADSVESAKISTMLAQIFSLTFYIRFQDENGPFKVFASLSKIFPAYCAQVHLIVEKGRYWVLKDLKGFTSKLE